MSNTPMEQTASAVNATTTGDYARVTVDVSNVRVLADDECSATVEGYVEANIETPQAITAESAQMIAGSLRSVADRLVADAFRSVADKLRAGLVEQVN